MTLADSPYLSRQLIAYIGNKRSLLGFLADVFAGLQERRPVRVFLDPFAGSGAVSRLGRWLGYRVLANDWEFYCQVINSCHLGVEERDMGALFRERGGIGRALEELNSLTVPREEDAYISRYYAPTRTEAADFRTERLFYTAENGKRIDAVRSRIEEWYPGFRLEGDAYREKMVLLAVLLYQCATHTNTSGVFKAYHRGFGGYSGDALKRIMKEIRLQEPVLLDAAERAEVYRLDAVDFASRFSGDLCYLDPPYTTHQYGSNYHILNTVALWDKPAVGNDLGRDGRLREKAGIRKDWVKTRSPYCYRDTALSAFRRLFDAIDCRAIALSYNTEGIVPFQELCELLGRHGKLTFHSNDYVKYRGGRQSLSRQNYNLEMLLVVERGAEGGRNTRETVRRVLLERKIALLLKRSYVPRRVRERFACDGSNFLVYRSLRVPMPGLYRFDLAGLPLWDDLDAVLSAEDTAALSELQRMLEPCLCADKREEIGVLVELIENSADESERKKLGRRLLWLLRKFAFKKYRREFQQTIGMLESLARDKASHFGGITAGLLGIRELARKRFQD
jgi:adenine-specific DNA-methyltransferase